MPGIVRKIDLLGRVVIPSEIRQMLDIAPQDELIIKVEDDVITICKHEEHCVICGNTKKLTLVRQKQICGKCLAMANFGAA